MGASELRDAVRQIRNADLRGAGVQDPIEAAEVHGREIVAVGIAGPILQGAGDADHTLDAAVVRRDLLVCKRPVDIVAVAGCGAEIDLAEARRGAAPEICFAADGEAAPPGPSSSGRCGERDLVLPDTFGVLVIHVADGLVAGFRIAKAAELHIEGLAVIAKIPLRIEPPARV